MTTPLATLQTEAATIRDATLLNENTPLRCGQHHLNAVNSFMHKNLVQILPASLSADVNDYNPAGFKTCNSIRQTSGAAWAINSFATPALATDNLEFIIFNGGAQPFTLTHESGVPGGSKINCPGEVNVTVGNREAAHIRWDPDIIRWRVVSVVQLPSLPLKEQAAGTPLAILANHTQMWAAKSGQPFYRRDDGEIVGI